jgi:eukaryotic-like serine/threonine-protein kinase
MKWLPDRVIDQMRAAIEQPDLSGTRYRPVRLLAHGGMGVVWLADDTCLQRRVALKIVDIRDERGDLAARLLREAEILASLEHPGIVPVHDAGTLTDGRVFYAMKYVQGQTLERCVQSMPSTAERLRLIQRIAEPLAFAHSKGILHRDLKPSNIMIGPFGEVLLMDWGLAKVVATGNGCASSTPDTPRTYLNSGAAAATGVVGTPGFMSPEQALGQTADQRSDIFSLGSVMAFLLTNGVDHGTPLSSSPRPLAAICAKAMAPDAACRYQSVDELVSDISRYLEQTPVGAYRESFLDRAHRLINRHQAAIVLILVYLVMRGLFIFFARH